jgi:hypothetical protein|tara:strand:- start:23 stop:427 length:405 start_codon:yes stop_codon:yes gene_type:complete
MIVFCKKLLPDVLRIWTTDDWNNVGDFELFNEILDEFIEKGKKCIILFSNPNLPQLGIPIPPVLSILYIVSNLLMMKSKLQEGVYFNVIHLQDEEARDNMNLLLQYYTPANETHVVESMKDATDIINNHLKKPK